MKDDFNIFILCYYNVFVHAVIIYKLSQVVTNGLAGNGVSPLSRLVTNIFLSISQRFLFLIIKSNLFTNKYGITTFHIETILTVVFPKSIGICNNSFLWLYTNFTTSM